jgi:hypothetical protein
MYAPTAAETEEITGIVFSTAYINTTSVPNVSVLKMDVLRNATSAV